VQHRVTQCIVVRVLRVGLLRETLEWVDREECARPRSIPPRPQVRQPRPVLELPGEAKGRDRAALGRAPRVVAGRGERRINVVKGLAHTTEGVGGVPLLCQIGEEVVY
jgi:hypothetical protein